MKFIKTFTTALLGLTMVNAKLIMIIRHGEKIDDDHSGLSDIGQARANCLVESFGTNGTFTTPQKIYAQSLIDKTSTRPRDTVTPLAKSLDLQINLNYEDKDTEELVQDINNSPEEVFLVSWSKDKIKDIAQDFGIKDVESWDSDVFNEVWIITNGTPDYLQNRAEAVADGVTPIYKKSGKKKISYNMVVVDEQVEKCIQRSFPKYSQASTSGVGSFKANMLTIAGVIATLLYFFY